MNARKALLFLPLLAIAGGAQAHHSFAMFDQTKTVTLNGTIAEFQWTNPHAWIEIMVPDQTGKPVKWSVELNSPNNLSRQGFKRASLKPGDKAVVVINPLRDGKKGGLFNRVTLPSGQVLGEKTITGKPINVPNGGQ